MKELLKILKELDITGALVEYNYNDVKPAGEKLEGEGFTSMLPGSVELADKCISEKVEASPKKAIFTTEEGGTYMVYIEKKQIVWTADCTDEGKQRVEEVVKKYKNWTFK